MPRARIVRWSSLATLVLIAASCGSAPDLGSASADEAAVSEPAQEENVVIPDSPPAIEAGSVVSGSVEIDGVTIDYVTSVPEGFTVGGEAPLLLAFPPGSQDLGLTRSIVEGTYAAEAQRLGWVVVSPAAPGGELYFQGSERLIPTFLDWLETWVTPEGGAPHVAGISNGGISTFRYAAQNPGRVRSMIAFPGFPRSGADQDALAQLTEVPIRMFVGSTDTPWIQPAEQTVEDFTELGGDIELTIFPGEGHVMQSTADGAIVFELLESFRSP